MDASCVGVLTGRSFFCKQPISPTGAGALQSALRSTAAESRGCVFSPSRPINLDPPESSRQQNTIKSVKSTKQRSPLLRIAFASSRARLRKPIIQYFIIFTNLHIVKIQAFKMHKLSKKTAAFVQKKQQFRIQLCITTGRAAPTQQKECGLPLRL